MLLNIPLRSLVAFLSHRSCGQVALFLDTHDLYTLLNRSAVSDPPNAICCVLDQPSQRMHIKRLASRRRQSWPICLSPRTYLVGIIELFIHQTIWSEPDWSLVTALEAFLDRIQNNTDAHTPVWMGRRLLENVVDLHVARQRRVWQPTSLGGVLCPSWRGSELL